MFIGPLCLQQQQLLLLQLQTQQPLPLLLQQDDELELKYHETRILMLTHDAYRSTLPAETAAAEFSQNHIVNFTRCQSSVLHPPWQIIITGHFWDESFRAITCNRTDNTKQSGRNTPKTQNKQTGQRLVQH